ncbi:RHS repeat-associated core domain-containing protein, partial [Geobacillus kaustophilus]|uniref:RHS repeat-associated core domain-containing protein n=1 Tax=Geobacillus kaustophilus TaxID=1462 RepID=UPI000ACF127F
YGENGQLLAMKKGNATYFYHYNAHGDVIALTDAQGNIVARYQYDAWGNILSQSGILADENPYRYAGYQYDQETGLYYLIARYYHPTHGVFLSLDPDPGNADDIITQNGYVYANNNPVKYVDPDGRFSQRVRYALKKGFQAWIGQYVGMENAGALAEKLTSIFAAASTTALTYQVVYILESGKASRTLSRVATQRLLREARKTALKAAVRMGIRVGIPIVGLADAWVFIWNAGKAYLKYPRLKKR